MPRLLSLLLVLSLALLGAAPAAAQVGARLDDAKRTDFFTFFHLQETARSGDTVEFRPKGPMFRSRVVVRVVADDAGRIRQASLALDRAFVDEPMSGIFARDIAKSFLRFATPTADLPRVETLANEIEFPRETPGYRRVGGPTPRIPATPTPGYQVYLGERAAHELRLARQVLRLENVPRGQGDGVLSVSVAPRK